MATAHPIPAPANVQPRQPLANSGNEVVSNHALVTMPPQQQERGTAFAIEAPVARLPVELDVAIPVRDFRVRNLLALEAGLVIESQWGNGEDVPLASSEVQLAWSEFEVIDTQLAVRITRLA
ncbi:MAG TPA: FliM/FliN family flagellar motor C-terminal domain-containing protein [Terracidiphilus sp.]|nr:FliM/FliN family flagellar motor C-terminal domain-containing protein [Terracidiphilus sp.]